MLTPWAIDLPESELPKYFGFVYLITHKATGKKYIGRKYLWKTQKTIVPNKKRRLKTIVESDWRYYKSSCKELQADIATLGLGEFEFTILRFCLTRAETNYYEVAYQFKEDVLNAKLPSGDYAYYNTNILSRYFRGRV